MICVDYKVTIWDRLYFNDDANVDNIIELLKNGEDPRNLTTDEYKFSHCEFIDGSSELISPEENDNQSTIEVIDLTTYKGLWTNESLNHE